MYLTLFKNRRPCRGDRIEEGARQREGGKTFWKKISQREGGNRWRFILKRGLEIEKGGWPITT